MKTDLSVEDSNLATELNQVTDSSEVASFRSESALPSQQAPATTESDSIDTKAMLSALRRKWFVASFLGVLFGGAAAVGAWQYLPAPFRAFSELRISSVGQKILFSTAEAQSNFGTYKQTQAKLITSPYVLNTALRDPAIAALPILAEKAHPSDWLEKNLRISFPGQEFIQISLEGDQPSDLPKVINAVSDAFLEEVVNKERINRQNRLRTLEEFNRTITEDLRVKRADLEKLAQSLKTTDPETLSVKQQMEYEYYGQLREEFTKLRFDLMQASIQLSIREKREAVINDAGEEITQAPQTVQEILVSESLLNERISISPEYKRIEDSIRQLEWSISDRLQRLGAKHPDLVRQEGQLERLNELALEIKAGIKKRLLIEAGANDDASTAELENRIGLLQVEKDHLEEELAEWKGRQAGEGSLAFELEELKSDIEHKEETANQFRNEIEALTIELQAPQRITLHRKAETPHEPQMSKKYKMAGMAGLGMFGLIAGGIVFLDYRRRRVSNIEEVAGNLRMRIIGAIPSLPRAVLKAVEDTSRPLSSQNVALRSVLKEAVDSARAVLVRDARMTALETILISSASDGEGKTSIACHLATSLARAGKKVVLVDCDLRRPTVHRVYNLDSSLGICEIMRGDGKLEDAIQESPTPGLSIVPAGKVNSKALQLLAEGRARDIFNQLKEDFEFIIIDSAPLLPVSDTLLLAQDVDSVIMAIQRDISRLGNISAAKQRLEMIGVPPSGAILIGLDEFADKYGYYSRHYNTVDI